VLGLRLSRSLKQSHQHRKMVRVNVKTVINSALSNHFAVRRKYVINLLPSVPIVGNPREAVKNFNNCATICWRKYDDMLSFFNTCARTWRMDRHTDRRTELLYKYPGLFERFLEMHNPCLSHQPPPTSAVTRLHKVFKKDGGVEQRSSLKPARHAPSSQKLS